MTISTARQIEPQPELKPHLADMAVPLRNRAAISEERQVLDRTLNLFNQMSRQLTDSYEQLESQVEHLNGELAQLSARRITELAEKERLANQLELLLTMLPAGVLLLDQNGCVAKSNPVAEQLLAALAGVNSLIGQRWRVLINQCFAPRHDDGHEVSLVDGRRLLIRTTPMIQQPGQLVLLTDMTETRALQAKLAQHQRLSAMGKMVASLAHQVRTPLSAATLYAGHLANPDLDQSARERFAGKLMERLRHLEHQVRDMLIFARGDLPLHDEISIDELLYELEAAMEVPVGQSQAQYQITNLCTDSRIRCNRDALVSSLMNLVNNALEACRDARQRQIELTIAARPGGQQNAGGIVISVADNGPGLSAQQKQQVLEPFHSTKANGTGLGLAVVQAVARAHGGLLTLEDSAVGGLCASIRIPAVMAQPGH
ncbi:sensor histidine kinase [Oceanobacter mangrovi]|uniref:sensor histidine kinase n=1 Tax=Oceanobacter mangrovi TaxID=2862510 RepID=UPI001FE2B871|nr:ATP-binding protein [Oceanobacter mangrovi]